MQEPVLRHPDFSKEFILQTDASEIGLGAVLSQELDGEEHPILYLSRKLFPREQHYSTIEKEALAVRWTIDTLRYYLMGNNFWLITDHASLRWIHSMKDTNPRIMRWYLSLQPSDFRVFHCLDYINNVTRPQGKDLTGMFLWRTSHQLRSRRGLKPLQAGSKPYYRRNPEARREPRDLWESSTLKPISCPISFHMTNGLSELSG